MCDSMNSRTMQHLQYGMTSCAIGFAWPDNSQPIAFLDCNGQEHRTSLASSSLMGTSFQNNEEAVLVVKLVQQLLSGGNAVQAKDIGIITPYSGQVTRQLLQQHCTGHGYGHAVPLQCQVMATWINIAAPEPEVYAC